MGYTIICQNTKCQVINLSNNNCQDTKCQTDTPKSERNNSHVHMPLSIWGHQILKLFRILGPSDTIFDMEQCWWNFSFSSHMGINNLIFQLFWISDPSLRRIFVHLVSLHWWSDSCTSVASSYLCLVAIYLPCQGLLPNPRSFAISGLLPHQRSFAFSRTFASSEVFCLGRDFFCCYHFIRMQKQFIIRFVFGIFLKALPRLLSHFFIWLFILDYHNIFCTMLVY